MSNAVTTSIDADTPPHFRRGAPLDAHQRRRHQAILSALQPLPAGRVLDYGCGWGDITWAISRTHPDIHAVDVNEQRIRFAKLEYAPLDFSVCTETGVAFPDASFDIVTSVVVLPFVPDEAAYLNEIRRVLRPGGHLILVTRICPLLRRLWHRMRGQIERSRHAPEARRIHLPSDVRRLLADADFCIVGQGAFYDPPFDACRNPADIVSSSLELIGESFGVLATAPYRIFVARKDAI